MITFGSNVLFALRFMIDHKIGGGNWVEIPAGKYSVRRPEPRPQVDDLPDRGPGKGREPPEP